jgi:hypothetical protein
MTPKPVAGRGEFLPQLIPLAGKAAANGAPRLKFLLQEAAIPLHRPNSAKLFNRPRQSAARCGGARM